jgi:DNA-binding transcriptional ArsR family regulator
MLGQWNSLVRRARIGREHKVAALVVSSYADSKGRDIRLSVARYAVDLDVSYSTARRYLTWLRKVGLLELVRAGSRRNGTASVYRLVLGEDVMEHLDVLSPSRQKELADEMREANRAGVRDRAAKAKAPVQRSPEMSAETGPDEGSMDPVLRSPERAQKENFSAHMDPLLRSPWMTYTPSRTYLSEEVRPSRADDEDVDPTSHQSRATGSSEEIASVIQLFRAPRRTPGPEPQSNPEPRPARPPALSRRDAVAEALAESAARRAAARAEHQARLAAESTEVS